MATLRILRTAYQHGAKWILENPIGSKLFKWTPLKNLFKTQGAQEVIVDYCRYGTPYRKRTRLMGTLEGLPEVGRLGLRWRPTSMP